MIPKLTDEAISRLPLESGRAELLEEIMSTVAPDRQNAEPTRPRTRAGPAGCAPIAAAAVVAGLAGGTLWWQQHRPEQDGSNQAASTLGLPKGQAVVLDAPGWQVDSLGGDGIRFRNGDAELEITSYAAKQYDSYVTDREHIVDPPAPGEPIEVLGRPAQMWAYSADDHTAIREVQDGHWMEFRGGGASTRTAYLALLGQLRMTSDAEFNAALPDDYVTEGERAGAAEQLLGEIQAVSGAGFPRGQTLPFAEGDAKDRYQFGAEVAGAYACAWLEAFENAKTHDQAGPGGRGGTGARHVPPVADPEEDGRRRRLPRGGLGLADRGRRPAKVPDGYREGLGCSLRTVSARSCSTRSSSCASSSPVSGTASSCSRSRSSATSISRCSVGWPGRRTVTVRWVSEVCRPSWCRVTISLCRKCEAGKVLV